MKPTRPFLFCLICSLLTTAEAASLNFNKIFGGNGADVVTQSLPMHRATFTSQGRPQLHRFSNRWRAANKFVGITRRVRRKARHQRQHCVFNVSWRVRTDTATGIALDTNGNIYVTGYTLATNFPTKNPLQTTNAGNNDIFVTKFAPDGHTLVYSTYVGGKDFDTPGGIAVDHNGNVVVTGYTQSTNFPTLNAQQSTFGGIGDAFVFKLNSNGSAFVYSTYLGGSGSENRANSDLGGAVALDPSGNAYVTGWTASSNFPVLNALSTDMPGLHAWFRNRGVHHQIQSGRHDALFIILRGKLSQPRLGIALTLPAVFTLQVQQEPTISR